ITPLVHRTLSASIPASILRLFAFPDFMIIYSFIQSFWRAAWAFCGIALTRGYAPGSANIHKYNAPFLK
ncbi:hypothetical protein, partial [Ruminococcus champanellensis]|uniref:hypothetical protein n=1 Tax=Ruminococcus champanellensis TaxID=1161942 RepID=UPI002E78C374